MAAVTLLLPSAGRIPGRLSGIVAAALGRAEPLAGLYAGERAQLQRHFELAPRCWPVAALTREADAGDAGGLAWLRADPAWVRPDINGARLFACGGGMHLDQADVDAILPSLQPLFEDAGLHLDAPDPSRWYLRLPADAALPGFAEPADALGADAFDYLPGNDESGGVGARRWRSLLSDAQVLLHNHPWNARRASSGRPPVNSLWFWGAGHLPDSVTSPHASVFSGDSLLRALAMACNASFAPVPARFSPTDANQVVDLRAMREVDALMDEWLAPACAAVRSASLSSLHLDLADGLAYRLEQRQRWRFWRKPLEQWVPPAPTAHHPGQDE